MDEVASDLALAGLSMPPRAAEVEEDEEVVFELWEENLDSYNWFVRLARRWVFNQFDGSRIRLDDVAVATQFAIFGLKKSKRKALLEDLLVMESAALEVLNKKKEVDRE